MFRNHLICFLFTLISGFSFSQSIVQGTLTDQTTGAPLTGIEVRTTYPDKTITDEYGNFAVRHRSDEAVKLFIELIQGPVEWNSNMLAIGTINVGAVTVKTALADVKEEFPVIILDEYDTEEGSNFSSLLQTGEDLFAGITDYTFSPAKFLRRGLESVYSEMYLNHLPMNDLESGGIYFSNWSGLNDVMRLDASSVGAEFNEWGFGGVTGSTNTDLRASSQWQKKISYAVTNRNYRNRITGTYSSGLKPSGWAYSVSASRRWAQEGYIPGTFYDGMAYFASVDKKINEDHTLNFVALGSPYKRGGTSASIQEMYDIADDHYYNPNWGFQQGEKRSSRIYSGHQPIFMLRHDWSASEKLSINTALGFQTGKSGTEVLDWLYGNDPRPDYYRRLPSYVSDPELAAEMRAALSENESLRQVQWDKLYEINFNSQFTVDDANGIAGNTITGALSRYVMEERRNDVNKKSGNVVLKYQLNENSNVSLGANVALQDTRNYKILADLLGGEFYLDWDKFAATDFPGNDAAQQNDLRRPNRIVYEGDQYGYDYYSRIRQQSAFLSYRLDIKKWEIGIGGSVKNHTYWRDGQTQNGKFAENSFGESEKQNFLLPSGKALVRYKIDGRNYLTVSGMTSQMAPTFRNAYVSPRTRDNVVAGLEPEDVLLGEARYDFTSPYFKFSLAGFYLTSQNGIRSTSFYHDDERTFVNFSLTNIDRKSTGVEAALQYTLIAGLTFEAAASVGQYIFSSRPVATVTQDNDGSVLQQDITIYLNNFYFPLGPQSAYTVGMSYASKQFWTIYVNVNRFDNNFISPNPLRRTIQGTELVELQSEQWNAIIHQEEFDPAWTVDASFYKSFKTDWIAKGTILGFNVGVTNLLDNTNYINDGYEQYRYDFETKDVSRFPSKYSYMQGLNYFIQVSLRF